MQVARRPTVEDREREIFKHLRSLEEPVAGATAREIWESVTDRLQDPVTVQAYYKVLDRLVAIEKLDVQEDAEGRRYALAPYLHAENAVTLDDVYELLDVLEPTDAIARVIDARDYFEEKRSSTLARAARALLDEEPLDLVYEFVLQKTEELRTDVEIVRSGELRDREIEARVDAQFREFHLLVYRYLGLSRAAVDAPRDGVKAGLADIRVDEEALRQELAFRIFGERFIMPVRVDESGDDWDRATVSGSDGSSHASVMQLQAASAFLDDVGHQVVTFNNSVVRVLGPPGPGGVPASPYYSVPMSRSAIDDRENRGMVLAPFMFRYLSESEYEHMAKSATDVVQWRADEKVFLGAARSLGEGALLPRPRVHIRDGTITPQEREWGHYSRNNEYGDMVREGLAHNRTILDRVRIAGESPPVFAGAVKATQARFFSMCLNWYIAKGSRRRNGEPLDPNWDSTRAEHIADNEAMSLLLSTLEDRRSKKTFYVTFALARPFHTLTEFFRQPDRGDPIFWPEWFEEKRRRELAAYEDGHASDPPYLASVADVSDDNFVHLCSNADYVAFYIGHTAGDPPPVVPRYEFLEGLRSKTANQARERVARNVRLLVAALHHTGLSADREHNYLSRKSLVKIIPFVVFDAHEKAKALGRKLESELRSIVVANLQALRNARSLRAADVEFMPLSVRRFVERFGRILREDPDDEPGRNER